MGLYLRPTRTRWVRRPPFIFVVRCRRGLVLPFYGNVRRLHQTFYFWFFLIVSIFFILAYNRLCTPWVASGL